MKINIHHLLENKISRYTLFGFISSIFLLLFSAYTTPLTNYYGYDSTVFMIIGKGLLNGQVPYLDLFDHKGPYLFFIQAMGQFLGNGKTGIFILQVINLTIISNLIFLLSKAFLKTNLAFINYLFFLLLFCGTIGEGNLTEEWSLIFILVPLFLLTKHFSKNKQKHPLKYSFIYGLCLGIVVLIRVNNTAIIAGSILGLMLSFIFEKKYSETAKNISSLMIGLIISIIPIYLYYSYHNALSDMINGTFVFNFKYLSAASEKQNIHQIATNFIKLFPLLILCLAIYLYDKKNQSKLSFIVIPSAIITFLFFIKGHSFNHYFTVTLPLVTILSAILLSLNKTSFTKKILLLFFIFIPFSWSAARNVGKNILLSCLQKENQYYAEAEFVINTIPTTERNSVWTFGSYNMFSDLRAIFANDIIPCYKYFYLQPILNKQDNNIQKEILLMMDKNPPKWIINDKYRYKDFNALFQIIDDKYELIYDSNENDLFKVNLYRLRN